VQKVEVGEKKFHGKKNSIASGGKGNVLSGGGVGFAGGGDDYTKPVRGKKRTVRSDFSGSEKAKRFISRRKERYGGTQTKQKGNGDALPKAKGWG